MDIPDFQPQQQNTNTASILNENKPSKLKKYLPIGIGALISLMILVLAFGVLQKFFTRASGEIPQNVVVSEQTENQAKITWTTEIETQGVVKYGTSPSALTFPQPETEKTKQHSVDLTLLSPGTTYYFNITVGENNIYDNGGVPWTFTTKEIQNTQVAVPTIATTQEEVQATPEPKTCTETVCDDIKAKIGKGCTTRDYFVCVKALTPTPTP